MAVNCEKTPTLKYGFLSEEHRIFPPMVIAQITNRCNLECIHCPHGFISKQKDYSPRDMKWETYEKIVLEVSKYKGVIFRLLCDGEPLMHPLFVDMARLAKQKGISPINFITNGILLNEKTAEALLEREIDAIEISLDALNKTTYEKIRKKSNYETVKSNTDRLIELRNTMRSKTKILVSIIDQPEVEQELLAFVEYWRPKVDRIIIRPYTSINGLVSKEKMKISDQGDRWPCPLLWKRLFINVDGKAKYCVEDWLDKTLVGDVNQQAIEDIWRSPIYQKIRDSHLQRKFDTFPLCGECRDWKTRDWGFDYFYALEKVLND